MYVANISKNSSANNRVYNFDLYKIPPTKPIASNIKPTGKYPIINVKTIPEIVARSNKLHEFIMKIIP